MEHKRNNKKGSGNQSTLISKEFQGDLSSVSSEYYLFIIQKGLGQYRELFAKINLLE